MAGSVKVRARKFEYGLVAGRAASPDPDAAHEGPARLAALIAEGASAKAVALIDSDRSPGTGHRDNEARSARVAASPVSKRPARVRAEPAATDGPEPVLSHRRGQ